MSFQSGPSLRIPDPALRRRLAELMDAQAQAARDADARVAGR